MSVISICVHFQLQLTRKTNDPNSYVELSIDQQSQKSKVFSFLEYKSNVNPLCFPVFKLSDQTCRSWSVFICICIFSKKVMFASKDPTYDECFTFFVHSVNNQVLNVEVNLS